MRERLGQLGLAGFTAALSVAFTAGCLPYGEQECDALLCGGGGIMEGCDPRTRSDAVADTCGVFVSKALAGGGSGVKGSKTAPVATIKEAAELAAGGTKTVYVCAGEEFEEVVPSGIFLFGGLSCSDESTPWHYVGNAEKTTIRAPDGEVALRIKAGETASIYDVHLIAGVALGAGQSSIAVIAEKGATALCEGCTIEALAGGDGMAGEVAPAAPAQAGTSGGDGAAACSDPIAGLGAVNQCSDVDVSTGGDGGAGTASTGANGIAGEPLGDNGVDNHGSGEFGPMMCTVGGSGAPGADGEEGEPAQTKGTIDVNGYTGAPGADGKTGKVGQGGGGGGGAAGGNNAGQCSGAKTSGASGGGGGAGGCGGVGGKGGKPGGSSIAIVSLGATVKLPGTTLVVAAGGKGGAGGLGQLGGSGGAGGKGGTVPGGVNLKAACAGGDGGKGGNGGNGGTGLGGHSLGIAYTAGSSVDLDVIVQTGETTDNGVRAGVQEF